MVAKMRTQGKRMRERKRERGEGGQAKKRQMDAVKNNMLSWDLSNEYVDDRIR